MKQLPSPSEKKQVNKENANLLVDRAFADLKTVLYEHYELLLKAIRKYPQSFDSDALFELNRLMAMPTIEFKKQRSARHILKIAYLHYILQKDLIRARKIFPEKRHLSFHMMKAQLKFPFGKKSVLGLAIGVCIKENYELLEERHILQSVLKYLPNISAVKRSFFSHHDSQEGFRLIYLELEKADNTQLTTKETAILRQNLSIELANRIEKLVPSLFATYNEEELMKDILILSRELKYVDDIPQAIISFEEQLDSGLVFSVIIARILKKKMDKYTSNCLSNFTKQVKCLQIRSQIIGYLRKSYPKEAIILRIQIPKESSFFRLDSSINVHLAREKIVSLIDQEIGEFRDYNGGMIVKSLELISQLKNTFREEIKHYPDLLEDIFYSIIPIEMQATLSVKTLEVFLCLFFTAVKQPWNCKEDYFFKIQQCDRQVYTVIRSADASLKNQIHNRLSQETFIEPYSLMSTAITVQGTVCFGYIYQDNDKQRREKYVGIIKEIIYEWNEKVRNIQILRLSVLNLPISLDPRLGGDGLSGNILRMLFDGLTRIAEDGTPISGVAQSVDISPDLKQYTFHLRDSYWSNGAKVTAYDFEYAWKKILSPTFKTSFAYLFYPIKNARLAKENALPAETIGIQAIDEQTLFIELEQPTPYFLELTAHTLYSPVHHLTDKNCPDWFRLEGNSYVCNGPFKLENQTPGHNIELIKNEKYWDKNNVKLDQIVLLKSPPQIALEMYQKNEIDWIGSPLSPWEPFFSSCQTSIHILQPSRMVYWCAYNTTSFPFNNIKVRQALAFAINREKIIEALAYDGLPATTPLPLIHTLNLKEGISDGNSAKAKQLFQEALKELGLKRGQFPIFTFIHINREIKTKIAKLIQQQWMEVLGVHCVIEGYEWKTLFSKMSQGDYQVGGIAWAAIVDDPLYILDGFKDKENPSNFTKWDHPQFKEALNKAVLQRDPSLRADYIAQAERLLIQELPVIPIFYEFERYGKKQHVNGVHVSKVGCIDFKSAYVSKPITKKS